MTDETLSTAITSIAKDYADLREKLGGAIIDNRMLQTEVRHLRDRIEALEAKRGPTTLGEAGTAGATWDVNFQSQGKDEPKAHL